MFEISAAVWALTDDRAGHTAHTLGLAEALGLEFEQKPLQFNACAQLPAEMLGASLQSLKPPSRALIVHAWPSLVIASGRRMVPIMRYIHAKSAKTRLIQCLWPGRFDPFHVILAPSHDDVPDHPRLIRYHGALHRLNSQALKDAALTYHALFESLPAPHYGVLIGGHSKHGKATLDNLHHLLDTAEFLVGEGSLILTTSRRTPKGFAEAIHDRLTCAYHLHEWGSMAANPYAAILARCEALIVSGDSVSMLSEASSTGKPVLIDTGFASMRDKHHRCAEALIAAGYAFPLRADCDLAAVNPLRLNETARIAAEVKARLHL